MGGTGQQRAPAAAKPSRPSGTEVHACADRRGKPGIAGYDDGDAQRTALPGHGPCQCGASLDTVMAEHDAEQMPGRAPWQPGDRQARLRQARGIGEQPQDRQARRRRSAPPSLDPARPRYKAMVHAIP